MNETPVIAAQSEMPQRRSSNAFYLLAVFEILMILCGAVAALLVAPASLFVSRTESEAFAWIVAGIVAACFAVIGLIVFPLALFAARGTNFGKRYGKVCGVAASALTVLQFPLGTIFGALILRKIFKREASGNHKF